MVSNPKTAAVMEEDNFDEYEIDEEFKRIFWQVGQQGGVVGVNGGSDDQELRCWLKSLLEDEDLDRHKDVVFIVGDKGQERTVRAHRLILTTRSRTFADILDGEADPNKAIRITGADAAVFETIVHYVYIGQIEAPKRVLQTVDLMHAAAKYDIAPLHAIIKHFLERRLPKLRIKHFIMITQRVLDLHLTELDSICFTLVEGRTDQVVQDPMFLRVSSGFIARLLELDNFSGISEASVFARVLEWATLRSGGSIVPLPLPTVPAERVGGNNSNNGFDVDAGFHLTRPDVRNVLEPFIRSFRLTSVPKDDLASLVKNSGVFTEHEQLVVSYYLLDQTKNLEDFSMKPRGTKIGSKRTADNLRTGPGPQKTSANSPQIQPRPIREHSPATASGPTHSHLVGHSHHHTRLPSPPLPPPPPTQNHTTDHTLVRTQSPPQPAVVVPAPMILLVEAPSASPFHAVAPPNKSTTLQPIVPHHHHHHDHHQNHEAVVVEKKRPSPPNGVHLTHATPPTDAQISELVFKPSLFRMDSRTDDVKPSTAKHAEHVHNPDFSIRHIVKSPPPVEVAPSPKLVDKIKQRFTSDKSKLDGKTETKAKKDKDSSSKKKEKLKKTPSGRIITTTDVKEASGSSCCSSASSRSHSPTGISRRRSMNVDGDSKDDTLLQDAVKKAKPVVAKRPKSMMDEDFVDRDQDFKDVASGSVGKKGGIRNGFVGLMARTKKWSPDHTRNSKETGKPEPPPRVKSTSDLSSKRNIVADI